MSHLLTLGVLGASRIAPTAVLTPAQTVREVSIRAVAARDLERAQKLAERFNVPHAYGSYDRLIDDPAIQSVYIALPPSLHAQWVKRAIAAGKHVLCEKPIAVRAAGAEELAAAVAGSGLVVAEAFHLLHHPILKDALAATRDIGTLQHIEATFYGSVPKAGDLRLKGELGGGALMDLGCYCVRMVRFISGQEPAVIRASGTRQGSVDSSMHAEMTLPGGATATIHCGFRRIPFAGLRVTGSAGRIRIFNPILPQKGNWLSIRSTQGSRRGMVRAESTYVYQLRDFVRAVRGEATMPSPPEDAAKTLRVIEAIYQAAAFERAC